MSVMRGEETLVSVMPRPLVAGEDGYRLLIVSPIPVFKLYGCFTSLDLWVRDLEAQADTVKSLCLLAPAASTPSRNSRPIPEGIRIVTWDQIEEAGLADALARVCDVIQ